MKKFLNYIYSSSTKRNITIGIAVILFINLFVFPFFSSENVNTKQILDLHFGFSLDDILSTFSIMGENGRKRYLLITLFIDTPYAMFYGFIYAFIIVHLSKKEFLNKFHYTLFVPFLISIFDLIENTGIIYFCLKYPKINPAVAIIISLANQLKWIFAALTLIITAILILSKFKIKPTSNNV